MGEILILIIKRQLSICTNTGYAAVKAKLNISLQVKVSGGEVIALTGNGTKDSFPPLVEFQLWHMGQALNPEDYIAF